MRKIEIVYVPTATLRQAPYNPRTMSNEARVALQRGMRAFDLVEPIIARRADGLVIGGHQRLQAAVELAVAEVPVVFLDDLTDEQAKTLNVLLNNPNAQGSFDMAKLADVLSDIDANGYDATLTGFDEEQLADILGHISVGDAGDAQPGASCDLVVTCDSEQQREALALELTSRGHRCENRKQKKAAPG